MTLSEDSLHTLRHAILLFIVGLSGCPAIPPATPIGDVAPNVEPVPLPDVTVTPDVAPPHPPPTDFGPCDSALDCLIFPNSASICDHSECALQCVPGFANCDRELSNGCEQSLSTPANCGGCDVPCEPYEAFGTCAGGQCIVAACKLGFGNCDSDPTNGCETLLVTPTDCGDCGVPCTRDNAEPTCDFGECSILECLDGFGDCDTVADNGCEASLDSRLRCGSCDTVCEPGQRCATEHCSPIVAETLSLPFIASGISATETGDIIAIGTLTEDSTWAEQPLGISGGSDATIVRSAGDGTQVWARRIGGPNVDFGVAVATTPDGDVIATGGYQSGLVFDGALLPHTGGTDVFLTRFDADGNQPWMLGLGGLGEDAPTALAVDTEGGIALVGTAMPPASFSGESLTGNAGVPLGFVARYDAGGTALWSTAVVSTEPVTLVDVTTSDAGAVLVLAAASAPFQVEEVVIEDSVVVLTWSADGSFEGAQPIALEVVTAMAVGLDGDVWLAGVDADGAGQVLRLAEEPLSIDTPIATDLVVGADGSVHVTGHTTGAFDVGLGPVIVDGVFAARYDSATGGVLWFMAVSDEGDAPRLTRTPAGVAIAGQALNRLDD